METKKSGYSSRFALICVLIGGSVGTGNLWRFPRLVANTGGAAFIIVMTVCVFLTALPLLYVENFMGRATRHSAPGAFHDICGKKYTCLGMFATLAYLLMLAYYLVVLAWCLRYAGMSLTGGYFGVDKEALFTSVTTADPATIGVWVVALVLVYFGIAKQEALEKVSSILMPCLFGLLIGLVVYALTRKGAYDGLKYSFTLNPKSLVDINIWKEALTQVAWSIGPGTMMMITAAMVSHKDGDITLNSHVQAFGDMTVALLPILIVAIMTGLMYIYLQYSKHGYEIAVVGESQRTASYAGIKVDRVIIRTMVLSGALCALMGFMMTAGVDHTLTTTIVDSRGFTAVMVSWMSKFNPFIMIAASLLLVTMDRGASEVASALSLNHSFADILTGIILFFIIATEFFITYKVTLRKNSKKEA